VLWACGMGGYGIQTAMGNARFLAGLIHRGMVPADMQDVGLDAKALSPTRYH
jgi:glycine/D-amino acid oxidase-like deaminating enzyme